MALTSKLAVLRSALKPAVVSRGPIRSLPSRSFCTGASDEQGSSSSSSPFVTSPDEGLVFAKLINVGRNTLKTDIIHFFEGCNLNVDDLKVEYNKIYNPTGILVQFPSRASYDTANRQIARKGRLYKLMRIDRSQWDYQFPYDGKTVVVKTQRNAVLEDVERIFSGCNYDASATRIEVRGLPGDLMKLALVRFPTRDAAMTAVRLRNRSFCLNTPVVMHVLQ